MIKGNKGEWSELYVLLYLLATGELYAANEKLQKIPDVYFPIWKIMRHSKDEKIDFLIKEEKKIKIIVNKECKKELSAELFLKEAEDLYHAIKKATQDKKFTQGKKKSAFSIPKTEKFMSDIYVNKLAASSSDKTDITMQVHDTYTGLNPVMGFSIKSKIGKSPTLLNASKATNFVYEVTGICHDQINKINSINTPTKIIDRIKQINTLGGYIKYDQVDDSTFKNNLMLVDSKMDKIIAEMLLYFYETGTANSLDLINYLEKENPLGFPKEGGFYKYKYKKLLCAIALGLMPSKLWDGIDESNGGYIIVSSDGDVLAYHLYNRNLFEQYLLDNTKLERASTGRHKYAYLYENNNKIYIKLNLQIRFL